MTAPYTFFADLATEGAGSGSRHPQPGDALERGWHRISVVRLRRGRAAVGAHVGPTRDHPHPRRRGRADGRRRGPYRFARDVGSNGAGGEAQPSGPHPDAALPAPSITRAVIRRHTKRQGVADPATTVTWTGRDGHPASVVSRRAAPSSTAVATTSASGRRNFVPCWALIPAAVAAISRVAGSTRAGRLQETRRPWQPRSHPAGTPDEYFGVGRSRDRQLVAPTPSEGHPRPGRGVVCVVRIENRDDDAGVEDRQRHSRRSSSK